MDSRKLIRSIAKDILDKFSGVSLIDESTNHESDSFVAIVASLSSIKSRGFIESLISSTLDKYASKVRCDMVKSIKGNEKDSSIGLDVNTTLKSRHIHVCGMLYDESYAKNKNTGNSCIVSITESIDENKDDLVCVLIYVTVTSAE